MPYCEGENRNQITLFPESVDDYILSDHIARVIDEYVEQLDMFKHGFKFAVCPTIGRPPYRPEDLLKLYIYGYLNGVRSSRKLERETQRNVEVMWLLKKLTPDFKTISDFRKNNKDAIKKIFRDFNKMCCDWGLFGKEMVAIDSSKFRASNSKKNNYSKKKLDRQLKHINEKINKYLKELDENDERESNDSELKPGDIKEIIKQLRSRKETYEEHKKQLEESGENEISTTDPDARLMMSNNNGVDVSYNVQTSVDSKHKMVLDFEVTNIPNDQGQLGNLAIKAKELCNKEQIEVLADKGYYLAEDLKHCVANGITPYINKQTYSNGTGDKEFYPEKFKYDKDKDVYTCPVGKQLKYHRTRKTGGKIIGYDYKDYEACKGCSYLERCTRNKKGRSIFRHVDQDFLDTIIANTKANNDKYRLRQLIVEHPFGTIKRSWGAYYVLTRGINSVGTEMALSFMAYNLSRAISTLGTKEILKRLRERRKLGMA